MKNVYAEYDRSRSKNPFQAAKDKVIKGCNWKKSDSKKNIPGVFDARPRGHRAAWTVTWLTADGNLGPEKWQPLESLTSDELIAEATDIILRRPGDPHVGDKLVGLVMDFFTGTPADPEYLMRQLIGALRTIRNSYDEYFCPWSEPRSDLIVYEKWRPGWAKEGSK